MNNCRICDKALSFAWTDTHGIGQCLSCGTPYLLYHYEGEGETLKRVGKPPEICIKEEYIPLLVRYHKEVKRMIPSGYSMGYSETTQELASSKDAEVFHEWMKKQTLP